MRLFVSIWLLAAALPASAQTHITLRNALERAKTYGSQVQSAAIAAKIAHEDAVQARAAALPQVNAFNQFIYTEGNGTPSGVFVANDGVHVYNEQAVVHQELLSLVRRGEIRRAKALEAVANAKRDVALRGLSSTVVQNFYAVVVAARRITNARQSLEDAKKFLDITQKQERGGEAAHADVIKAQLQVQQRERDLSDALVNYEKAKVALAVLIFPDVTRDFDTEDDLESAPPLEGLDAARTQALQTSPDIKAANATLLAARGDVAVARYAYLPSLAADFFYGINANHFAARSRGEEEAGRAATYRQNLGYSAQVTLNIPVWNWGSTQSKIRQARLREEQARVDAGLTAKQLQANLAGYYLEAQTARQQMESLKNGVDLSAESLRLTLLRYTAGEATVLEVSDAQTTLATARNAYADGLSRYRVALANLQTLTGQF